MRKLSILFLSTAVIILSGCSLMPAEPVSNDTPQKFTLSDTIWRTTDGGTNWEARNQASVKPRVTNLDILSIAISPTDSRNVYIGLKSGGMMVTEDGGENWKPTPYLPEKTYGLAVGSDPRVVYATGVWQKRGKIFKSINKGQDWGEIYASPAEGPLAISLTIDRKSENVLYATTSDNQVLKTVDGGNTWKNIWSGGSPALKVTIDRANNNLIYVLFSSGQIKRSKDGGNAFEDVAVSTSSSTSYNSDFGVLEIDPGHSGWLYAAGGAGLFRSKDAGNTWEKLTVLHTPSDYPIRALDINPRNSDEIIYGAGQAVYKSIDAGKSWSTYEFKNSIPVSIIKYDPANPAVIFLGFSAK